MHNLEITNKIAVVKEVINSSIKEICNKHDVIVIINHMNQHALGLIYEGASSKSKDIKYYTERSGDLAGYILDPENYNTPLKDSDGRFVTSDLDILMIIGRDTCDRTTLLTDLGFGDIQSYEYKVSNAINTLFAKQLSEIVMPSLKKLGPIVTHGPFNRCTRLSQKCIHFPLTIFYPSDEHKNLGHEENRQESIDKFHSELENIQARGFILEIPDSWRLS